MNALTEAVRTALAAGPLAVPDLLRAVRAAGATGCSRAALERALAADTACVPETVAGRTRWRLDADAVAADAPDATAAAGTVAVAGTTGTAGTVAVDRATSRAGLDALALRDWQAEALAVWTAAGRGVVEAVTGAGKTRLALAAVRLVVERGGGVLVLVPGLALQDQWVAELAAILPRGAIGRLGGGSDDDLDRHRVVVATPQSAAGLPLDPPGGMPGLLVADEAHRLGAPTWGAALRPTFDLRLALTATFEREDDGVAEVLAPYFGEVVHRYGYAEAARDGVIAPFDGTLVGVPLTDRERARHDELDGRVRRLTSALAATGVLPRAPRELLRVLAAMVAEAERGGRDGPQVRAAREYLAVVRERRAVAAGAARKRDAVAALAPALAGHRTLAFTDRVAEAEEVAGLLRAGGVRAAAVHGGLDAAERRSRLAGFERGRFGALVAARVLDEGVDLPDADVALALSAFRTRRHLVQRLGRVLRRKADGRAAHLVLLHAAGTLEDPDRGGHHGFLAQVDGVARTRREAALTATASDRAADAADLADIVAVLRAAAGTPR